MLAQSSFTESVHDLLNKLQQAEHLINQSGHY